MKLQTKAIHAGDRKPPRIHIPSTTPIVLSSSFIYPEASTLDKVFANEIDGFAYSRYDNPTCHALQELMTELEGGHNSYVTGSGMAALHLALMAALVDRRKHVLAANALYGATISMLTKVLASFGVETTFVDICDLAAVEAAIEREKPGAILMETISNPILRVGQMDKIAELANKCGAALIVDNTFATPLILRPFELGAHLVVHSLTKYLAGHGDVLGGVVVTDEAHDGILQTLYRTTGPNLGPFEAYLAMRGIKTFPIRMERHCHNACHVASFLATHPQVDRVFYAGDPNHPDAATVARLFPKSLNGAIVSIEVKDQDRAGILAFIDRLKLVVRGTTLGDVHSLILYPAMASHRDMSPKQRERMGIRDNLVRLSIGLEAAEDICADLDQALNG